MGIKQKDGLVETAAPPDQQPSGVHMKTRQKDVSFRIIFIIMCGAAFIIVPLSWIFRTEPDFLELEKRYRETWPEISAETVLD